MRRTSSTFIPSKKWPFCLSASDRNHPPFAREALMVGAAVGSWFTTRKEVHEANQFDFHPIQEVAILFIGIRSQSSAVRARGIDGGRGGGFLVYHQERSA